MRILLLLVFFTVGSAAVAQDNIYFLNGEKKTGKVLEISETDVTVQSASDKQVYKRNRILLIEYSNGTVEIFDQPESPAIYDPDKANEPESAESKKLPRNYTSLNTLALCNSDISAFYERMPGRKYGFGVMGAYNFNRYATIQNAFIGILHNGKKLVDMGAFVNVYKNYKPMRTSFYYGVLFKYTAFRFNIVRIDSVAIGTNYSTVVKFIPARGNQFSTIFTIGTHSRISEGFYIKTILGIGGFILRGDYYREFNRVLNEGVTEVGNSDPQINLKFLPKLYFGVNAGFQFK